VNEKLKRDYLLNLEGGGRSPNTISAYGYVIADFLDFTLGLSMAEVTHREISEWFTLVQIRIWILTQKKAEHLIA
jgi:hypothetical protein